MNITALDGTVALVTGGSSGICRSEAYPPAPYCGGSRKSRCYSARDASEIAPRRAKRYLARCPADCWSCNKRPGRVQAVGPAPPAVRRFVLTEYGSVTRPLRARIGSAHEAHDLPASHALCRRHHSRCRRPSRRGSRERPGGRHKGQPGSVQQSDKPTRDRGRAGHLRVREHRRGGIPGRPLLQRRRDGYRVRAVPRWGGDVDPGLPPRAHVQRRRVRRPGQSVRASKRPECCLRRQARHVADLVDPAFPEPQRAHGLRERVDRWRSDVRFARADPSARGQEDQPRQELDRLRQPRGQPVLRQLLHGVRQLRRERPGVHEHVEERREHLEHGRSAGRQHPRSRRATPRGLGGQPVVRPDGTVTVPFESLKGTIGAFRSTDGGATWSKEFTVSKVSFHPNSGGLRTSPLPTAEIDADGNVYVAWEDCRFEPKCSANDIVFSTSPDGVNWSAVRRIPIDAVGSGVDHFVPGLAVNSATRGAGADLALTYYFYPDAACTPTTCQLNVGFVSSPDGGAHWGAPTQLAGPMSLADIAATSQGTMVGDYVSTSFNASGNATAVFAIGNPHTGNVFDEGMWAPAAPLPVATATQATRAATNAGAATGVGVGAAQEAVRSD